MITIDYQSKLPLYEQIAKRFQTLILKGALPPDSQMPSVRSLAMDLSINPNTIQKAYSLLEQERYIYPVKDAEISFPIRRFSLNRQRKHFSRTFLALSQTEKNSE